MLSGTITLCSEAQIMPLSKVLEWMMELTASRMSALSSMMAGTLPAPRPAPACRWNRPSAPCRGRRGGQRAVALAHDEVGHLQAGHVDPGDDVLRRAGRHRRLQHDARGLGRALPGARMREMMMPLRVFRQASVLKMAVEVGLVVGITAAITPRGSARRVMP